ncbi:discoidin domain-containing protein [Paenibacillus whitsoniae]|nr:discoidin domain-containing protein [Paenibacillus whitsoniae]
MMLSAARKKLAIYGMTLTLLGTGMWGASASQASAAAGMPMVVNSLTGPVTKEEIDSFKQYILSSSVTPPVSNLGNDFVYGPSGQNVEAMGYMYEISGDTEILDQMIRFSELMLSARNNPDTGRVLWNGNRELVWPNKKIGEVNSDGLVIEGYSGSENGDVIGHIAYSAKLILENKSIWNQVVPFGNSAAYGETYLQRAKAYVAELDQTIDTYMIPNFVKPDTLRQYWPEDPRWSTTGSAAPNTPIPWNQQMMMNNGFMRLAEAHELLADDQARVNLYDSIIQASIDWFTSSLQPYQVNGHEVYKWWYVADYFGKVEDADGVHAANDVMGMTRAYERGKYGVTLDTLMKLSNTIRYVISNGSGNFYCKVDGLPTTCTLTNLWSEYLHIAPYDPDPATYQLLANPYYMSTTLTSPIYFARVMWVKDHRSWTRNVDADLSPAMEAETYSSRIGRFTRAVCDSCFKGAYMQAPDDTASELTYSLNVAHGGQVYLHAFGAAGDHGAAPGGSFMVSLDGGPEAALPIQASDWGWTTVAQTFPLSDGLHLLTIRGLGDGARLDQVVLSKSATPPIEALQPKLTDLQVNGVSVPGFSPGTHTYSVAVPLGTKVIPTISATSEHVVEIAQPQDVFGTAVVTVKDRLDPYLQSKYEVKLTGFPIYGEVPDRFISFPIQSVTASAGYHASFPPSMAIDGDLTTRYAAKGTTQWIQFDLGDIRPVRSAVIAFLKGDVDRYIFDLQVSEDGTTWTTVYSGKSSGKTAGLEIFPFGAVNARYIKYNGKGNSKDTWNNINEMYIGGQRMDTTPPVTTDDARSGWQTEEQTVHLTAADADSGVAHTFYRIDDGAFAEGTTVEIETEGTHTLTYYSIDAAGNQEQQRTASVQIDLSAPRIVPTVTMSVYATDPVRLDFQITDAGSGVNSSTVTLDGQPVPLPYTAEPLSLSVGRHTVTVRASDQVGHLLQQTYTLQVNMDIEHLDEAVIYAKQQGWIRSEHTYTTMMVLVSVIQKASHSERFPALHALEKWLQAQSSKTIDAANANRLLEMIAPLQVK